jgi:hypothetical protein
MELLQILALIKKEMTEIERTVMICINRQKKWNDFIKSGEEDILIDSIATCLHSFYTGTEKIFEIVAVEIDGGLPKGEKWHLKLIELMQLNLPIRCPVLSERTTEMLDEYRAFRHLFRNIYTHRMIPEKVMKMCDKLLQTWQGLKTDLDNFIEETNA